MISRVKRAAAAARIEHNLHSMKNFRVLDLATHSSEQRSSCCSAVAVRCDLPGFQECEG